MKRKIFGLLVFLLCFPIFAESVLYKGDGGKSLSIEIDTPELANIGEEVSYLPIFVINTLTDDFTKYSPITVIDTHNQKKIQAAQIRDDQNDHTENTTYETANYDIARNLMIISILGKSNAYSLSIKINDKEKNQSIAAYNNANCSFSDLESGKVLKQATHDLLTQLGVTLTEEGKKQLLTFDSDENKKSLEAQKIIAQGDVLANNGSEIEALTYYIKARTVDKNSLRVKQATKDVSQNLNSSNYGLRARTLFQKQRDYQNLLETLTKTYDENLPYFIVYSGFTEGERNYNNHTWGLDLQLGIGVDLEAVEVYDAVYSSFLREEEHEKWGLQNDFKNVFPRDNFYVKADLLDKNNNLIDSKIAKLKGVSYFDNYKISFAIPESVTDSSNLKFKIDWVKRSSRDYYNPPVSYFEKEKKEDISIITFEDYYNNEFSKKFFHLEDSGVTDVYYISYPRSVAYDSYASSIISFFKVFGNKGMISDLCNTLYPNKYKIDDIVLLKSESKILNEVYKDNVAFKSKFGRSSFTWDVVIGNSNPKFPRDKNVYLENIAAYLPLEYVKSETLGISYVYMTQDVEFILNQLYYHPVNRNVYFYDYDDNIKIKNGVTICDEFFDALLKQNKNYGRINNYYLKNDSIIGKDAFDNYVALKRSNSDDNNLTNIYLMSDETVTKLEKKSKSDIVFRGLSLIAIITAILVVINLLPSTN